MKMSRVVFACLCAFALAHPAKGSLPTAQVFTDFPAPSAIGPDGLVVGDETLSATLFGGGIEVRGVLPAYATPPFAWVFDEGESGRAEFSSFPTKIEFFSNVVVGAGSEEEVNGSAQASLVGIFGIRRVPTIVISTTSEGVRSFSFDFDGQDIDLEPGDITQLIPLSLVRHLLLDHSATSDTFFSVDDFGFEAFVFKFGF